MYRISVDDRTIAGKTADDRPAIKIPMAYGALPQLPSRSVVRIEVEDAALEIEGRASASMGSGCDFGHENACDGLIVSTECGFRTGKSPTARVSESLSRNPVVRETPSRKTIQSVPRKAATGLEPPRRDASRFTDSP